MNRYDEIVKRLKGEVWTAGGLTHAIHLTEEQLDEAERLSGFKLPADYREFLRDYGNYAFYNVLVFPMQPNPHSRPNLPSGYATYDSRGDITTLFGYTPSALNSLQAGIDLQHQITNGEWPPDWLPIGGGEMNLLGLAIRGEHIGCVYYFVLFRHEDYLVAHSFDEFIHKVTLLEDEEDE